MKSIFKLLAQLLLLVSVMATGLAMAQAEPSMSQIYAAAQSGKLDEAQVMMQQVLVSHPKSAKAHFVQAELYARQGKPGLARESLATAEKYAPGLPFAKPEAVAALTSQLAARPVTRPATSTTDNHLAPQAAAQPSSSWAMPLILAAGVIAAGYFFFRRRAPAAPPVQPTYASADGLSGTQTFGSGAGAVQPAYAQPAPPAGYPPPQAGTGMGGRIMGGVATGLAVGAGVMAAQAIGRNLMGGHEGAAPHADSLGRDRPEPLAGNTDMGGANFGVSDTAWDDAGSDDAGGGGGAGGGGDWDS